MGYLGFRGKCYIPSPDASFVPYEFSMTIKALRGEVNTKPFVVSLSNHNGVTQVNMLFPFI
jgi:hypothetical protein